MKTIAIRTDGTIETIEIEPGLDSIQSAVGGYIEALQLTPKVHAYIDEEGKLKGKEVNFMATFLCRKLEIGLMPADVIVGDMFLFGTGNDGDSIDVPENFLADNDFLEHVLEKARDLPQKIE